MNDSLLEMTCDDVRELAMDNPEEAAVIMQMLKDAGEDCQDDETGS